MAKREYEKTKAKASTQLPGVSSTASERLTKEEKAKFAAERAELLFASYRRGDANEPEGYVLAITAVLTLYDPDVIRLVTDPRTGVQTDERFMTFMPNAGELKRYCDAIVGRSAKSRYAGLPPFKRIEVERPEPFQGQWANVFVPRDNRIFQAMVDRAQKPGVDFREWKYGQSVSGLGQGIWVVLSWAIYAGAKVA